MTKKRWGLVLLAIVILAGWWKWSPAKAEPQIAVIHVEGVILGGRGQSGLWGENGGVDGIIRQLHEARDDDAVKAIILRINSPGGSATASQELGEEILKVRAGGKPVVSSMGDIAASGGYWLAACTERIYANPSTITGSIGVYMPYANWEELYQKIGIRNERIQSGPHKDILSPDRAMTATEKALLQAMVNDMYEQFVAVVSEGRSLPPEQVRLLADGRIYTGRQALASGLVDEMGNLYDAIDGTVDKLGLAERPMIREMGQTSPWDALFGRTTVSSLVQQAVWQALGTAPKAAPVLAPMALPAAY